MICPKSKILYTKHKQYINFHYVSFDYDFDRSSIDAKNKTISKSVYFLILYIRYIL